MNQPISINFRIIESMMFRGPGEFDPFVKGTYSRAITLPMPSPSTVAGTLATYCISKLNISEPRSEEWFDKYINVLGNDIVIRGPLIKIKNTLMAEDRISRCFLTLDSVKRKCIKKWEELKELSDKPESIEKLDDDIENEEKLDDDIENEKVEKDVRIGVMLQTRDEKVNTKTTKEGFLYGAEYINYISTGGKEREETLDNMDIASSVEIVIEVRGNIIKCLSSAQDLPVKFGGEGRVAFLSFKQKEEISSEIKNILWNGKENHKGTLALYLATPALFKGGIEIKRYVEEWAISNQYMFKCIFGESTILGAGFMIKEGRRKPIYTALNPGSIIFLEGSFDLHKMYVDTALGESSKLGYCTCIPIPITYLNK